jgi:hypothetical protein
MRAVLQPVLISAVGRPDGRSDLHGIAEAFTPMLLAVGSHAESAVLGGRVSYVFRGVNRGWAGPAALPVCCRLLWCVKSL